MSRVDVPRWASADIAGQTQCPTPFRARKRHRRANASGPMSLHRTGCPRPQPPGQDRTYLSLSWEIYSRLERLARKASTITASTVKPAFRHLSKEEAKQNEASE